MAWTEPEKARFRALWAAGETVSAIARKLGKSPSSVKYHRKALGLRERDRTPLERTVRVGMDDDTYRLFRSKARRAGQTLAGRLRALVLSDLNEP